MSTRTLLLFTVTSVLVLSLEGCQPANPPAPVTTNEPTPEEKNIAVLIAEDPPSFNPMVADTGYDALVMELVMLGLTDVDPNGTIIPELAAEFPTADNGGVVLDEQAGTMSVTWKMRQDVQWQDGQPVTANDVLFTWNAITDPDSGSWIRGLDYIDSVEQLDDYTFVVNYNTIYPGYLTQFGGEQIAIWPAHYCNAEQGFVAWGCGRQPLSDGPFVLQEWVEGDHLTFTKNKNFYIEGKPEIEKVIVEVVPDDAVRKTRMLQGDADVDVWINVNTVNDLRDSDVAKVSLSPTDRWVMRLFMNEAERGTTDAATTPHPILSDVRVRQAIRKTIDVDTIIQQIFYGLGQPVWTEFFRMPYDCGIPRPQYDPDAAKDLLGEAGWIDADNDGVRECHGCQNAEENYPMEMELITYAEYGEPMELTQQLIGEMLGKVGIKVNLTVVEGSVLWDTAENGGIEQSGNYDIDLWDDSYAGVDPTDYLWEVYSQEAIEPGMGWNIMRWDNPAMDALIDEAYTLDEGSRRETFCQMAKIINEELPIIHMFTVPNADAYSGRLAGVQSSASDLVTWNIADWKIK